MREDYQPGSRATAGLIGGESATLFGRDKAGSATVAGASTGGFWCACRL